MDCRSVAALLSQHALAELSADQRAAVAAHMDSCAACREKWGLDQPLPIQYLTYLANLLHGDMFLTSSEFRIYGPLG